VAPQRDEIFKQKVNDSVGDTEIRFSETLGLFFEFHRFLFSCLIFLLVFCICLVSGCTLEKLKVGVAHCVIFFIGFYYHTAKKSVSDTVKE